MSLVIGVASITFNNNTPDGNGTLWYCTGIQGWGGPETRTEVLQLPAQHGEKTVSNLYGPRLLTLTGVVKATSEANFWTAWHYLESQTNALRTPVVMTVTEASSVKRIEVIRSGALNIEFIGKGSFGFELNLRADDPFKYSNTLHTDADLGTINNAGTIISYPTFTLTGSGTPTITVGSLTWWATDSLPSGTVIDMKNQTVLDGVTSYYALRHPESEWVYLSPGNNTVASTVAATISWRDAWV